MRSRLRRDLISAVKARDVVAVSALRAAIAAIDNAEAVDAAGSEPSPAGSEHIAGASAGVGSAEVPRRRLSHEDELRLMRAQVDERTRAAHEYEQLGHADAAARLRGEAETLRVYANL